MRNGDKKSVRACGTTRSILTNGVNVPISIRRANNWDDETYFRFEKLDRDSVRLIEDNINGTVKMSDAARLDVSEIVSACGFPETFRTIMFIENNHATGQCYMYFSDDDNTLTVEGWNQITGYNDVEENKEEPMTPDTKHVTYMVIVNLKNETIFATLNKNSFSIPFITSKSGTPANVTAEVVRAATRRKVIDTGYAISSGKMKTDLEKTGFEYVEIHQRIFID